MSADFFLKKMASFNFSIPCLAHAVVGEKGCKGMEGREGEQGESWMASSSGAHLGCCGGQRGGKA